MATAKARAKAKKGITRWNDGNIAPEDMKPCERIAHTIVSEFGDLTPSVERIMTAELDDDERARAMALFEASLNTIGDPHRDPRVAIEASRSN